MWIYDCAAALISKKARMMNEQQQRRNRAVSGSSDSSTSSCSECTYDSCADRENACKEKLHCLMELYYDIRSELEYTSASACNICEAHEQSVNELALQYLDEKSSEFDREKARAALFELWKVLRGGSKSGAGCSVCPAQSKL